MTTTQNQTRLRPFRPVPFGRYTLLAELAKGGMGEIYLARFDGPQGFEKLCEIKKILPHLAADPDFVERFVNEAKTVVKLTHGSIAQVLDMGLQDGEPYLALEHVDGKDLRKVAARMRDRQLPIPLTVVLFVMSRVLDALAYAHRKRDDDEKEISLVHRDISPQNVLVSYEGEVKVIDFGLAKSSLNHAKTNPSIILGKFLYMSPEQARHAGVDRRSDLYAAGLCLYELIHGKNPFDSVPTGELITQVASPKIPPLLEVEPLCPPTVAQVVGKALQADPADRFQTAEEFRGKLLSCLLDIDASAGPESVSRFMREAFAAEYQAERRMLAGFRETMRPRAEETVALSAKELQSLQAARSSGPKPQVTPLLKGRPPGRRDDPDPLTEHDVPIIRAPEFERPREEPEVTLPRVQMEPGGPSELTQPRAPLELERPPPRPPGRDADPRALPPLPDTDPAAKSPPRPGGNPVDLQVTQPRAVLPPLRSEQTQPHADLPPLPEAKADTQPRVVMGTLLPEEAAAEAAKTTDPAMTWRPVTPPPAADAAPLLGAAGPIPTQELAVPASLGLGGSPQPFRAGRTGWLVVIAIVAVTLGAAAFFLWDMYRSGAFIADGEEVPHARPSDAVPVVAVKPPPGPPGPSSAARDGAPPQPAAPAPSAPDAGAPVQAAAPPAADAGAATPPGTALAAAVEPELEPLANATAPKKAPPRKKPSRPNPLGREWAKARSSFELLVRSRPCEAPSMALLCTRYDALRLDVEQADPKDLDRLLVRVHAFYDAVEQKRGHK